MKKIIVACLLLSGCWLIPPPGYKVNRNSVDVIDMADVGKSKVDSVITQTLQRLGAHPSHLKGLVIQIVPVPICVEGEQDNDGVEFILADGLTMKNEGRDIVLVSTIQGCHDGLVHELGHYIQLRRDGIKKSKQELVKDHKPEGFWQSIKTIEEWVRETQCKETYKPLTPEEGAKQC